MWLVGSMALLVWSSCGEASEELDYCGSALRLAPAKENEETPRRYAPERQVDVTHVTIDVTPEFGARTIRGVTTIAFTPIAKPLTELKLDAMDLNVAYVHSPARIAGYTATDTSITITFSPPVLPGDPTTVTIRYDAEPQRGMYFRTPQMGYPEGDTHLFTQGESHEAPYLYPNYDYLNERFSSWVICRVRRDAVPFNGRLIPEETDRDRAESRRTGRRSRINYLVALAAGRFGKVESRYRESRWRITPLSEVEQGR
jgi:aminopeptidase N